MATYAAFKHVELYNVGKAKKRVLKPPGGGSSDLFGGSVPSTPRSVRNNMASNIFAATVDAKNGNGESHRRPQQDSHNRLFGNVERVPSTPKSYQRSNIPIGSDATDAPKLANGNAKLTNGNGAILNGNGAAALNGNGIANENNHKGHNGDSAGMNGHAANGATNGSRSGSDISMSSPSSTLKQRKIFHAKNGFDLASPIKRNVSIGNGYAMNGGGVEIAPSAPLTNLSSMTALSSSSTTSSSLTQNSSASFCSHKSGSSATKSPRFQPQSARNPVLGIGCQAADSYRGRRRTERDGNPITGEGYNRGAAEINTTVPSLNGAKQVINKNRIPPGGFSSGLW